MSTQHPEDVEGLIEALRADLPDERDRERVRARLVGLGVAVASSAAASSAATAGASALGTGAVASKSAQVGLWSKLAALSLGQKLGVAAIAVATASALPAAPQLMRAMQRDASAPSVTSSDRAKRTPSRRHAAAGVAASTSTATRIDTMKITDDNGRADAVTAVTLGESAERVAPRVTWRAPVLDLAPHSSKRLARASVLGQAPESGAREVRPATPEAAANATSAVVRADGVGFQPDTAAPLSELATSARSATPTEGAGATPAAPPQASAVPAPTESAQPRLPSTLREETALLERALAAISAGDRELAQSALEQHAARFPHGILERERRRAWRRLAQISARERTNADPAQGANEP